MTLSDFLSPIFCVLIPPVCYAQTSTGNHGLQIKCRCNPYKSAQKLKRTWIPQWAQWPWYLTILTSLNSGWHRDARHIDWNQKKPCDPKRVKEGMRWIFRHMNWPKHLSYRLLRNFHCPSISSYKFIYNGSTYLLTVVVRDLRHQCLNF